MYGPSWRASLSNIAWYYRNLEELIGRRIEQIRVIGGGSKNRLLNQMTADATGRRVIAGPAEATALGNVALQILATGAAASLKEVRGIMERSFPAEVFEPVDPDKMGSPGKTIRTVLRGCLCLKSKVKSGN